MKSEKLYDAFNYIDDWYLDIVDTPQMEATEMKKQVTLKRTLTVLLAAAIAVSILTITAAAAGWIPGIFSTLKEELPKDRELFEAAAEANSEAQPEVVEIPPLDYSKFTLFERYYDGQTILLGYNLDEILPDTIIGYEPNEEILEAIYDRMEIDMLNHPDDTIHDAYANSRLAEEAYEGYLNGEMTENAKQYNCLSESFIIMDNYFKHTLSEEDYDRMWQILLEKGYVCVITYSMHVGDHKYVNGVDMFETYNVETNAWAGMTEYSTEAGECLRLEPLPEAAQNQDSVTVDLKLKSGIQYNYLELGGRAVTYYALYEDDYIISFTLENVNN